MLAKTIIKERCPWCGDDPTYQAYHDTEWGVPLYDSQKLFEFLILEGMQAGLSWITILKKRDNYRRAFSQFDAEKIARYGDKKFASLIENPGIVRNRLKIHAIINNAKCYLALQEQADFSDIIWQFVDGKPILNRRNTMREVPASTEESDNMSKYLKQQGFKFIGSTICYAYMQAVGMVNDHLISCYRYTEVQGY